MRFKRFGRLLIVPALLAVPMWGQHTNALPRTIVVLVRPHQMEPFQVDVPAGPVEIVVQNHSTARHIQLVLAVEKGNQLRQVELPPSKQTSHEVYTLSPGTYILSEASHPAWACRIVVK